MLWNPGQITSREIEEASARRKNRNSIYKDIGHDRKEAVSFIVDSVELSGKNILDIGTGQGFAAVEIARRGIPVVTVDISEENLHEAYLNAIAESVEELIEFHLLDAGKLSFEDESFDLVVMVNALHHIEDFEKIASEISRVLRVGGIFVTADFTEEGFGILNSIMKSEGREHQRMNSQTINDISKIIPKFGMVCRSQDIRFHEHVMIAEKG